MLPFDRRPWARKLAVLVIVSTVLAVFAYALAVLHRRPMDTGEKAILLLLLLTVIPPNVAIVRRESKPQGH